MARTVLITGGSRGLGAAITRAFHAGGAHVLIAARNDTGLARALGERARFVATDVRSPPALRAATEAAVSWTGSLDVLVNNAGFSAWRPLAEIDEEFWNSMIGTNLKGVLFATQAAAARMAD